MSKISDERREVARRLRREADEWRKTFEKYPDITGEIDCGDVNAIMQDAMHFCGIDGKTRADAIFDRLVDLIEPQEITEDTSDGYHTFGQLYYQRMVLFAVLVQEHKERAWKTRRHEDGELCFGGGWFLVTIDTPSGAYGYHYEDKYWQLFDCEELPKAKPWDGYTEKDVGRLLSLVGKADTQERTCRISDTDHEYEDSVRCDACHMTFNRPWEPFKFCPNCGARVVSGDGD